MSIDNGTESLNVAQDAAAVATELPQASKPATLLVLKDNDQFSPITTYLGEKKVSAVYSFRPHKGGKRYRKDTLFDFSGVSEEQLYLLAMYGVKVTVQAILRASEPHKMLDPGYLDTVDVQKIVVDGQQVRGNPTTIAVKALMRLGYTEAQAQQIASGANATAVGDADSTGDGAEEAQAD